MRRLLGADVLGLVAVSIQLVLVALALSQLDMLTSAFRRVFYLAGACFLVNHLLPKRFRLGFFAAVCIGAVALVMGGSPDRFWDPLLAVQRTVPLLVCGAILAYICLLPVKFWIRCALLTAAGAIVAALRADLFGPDDLLIVWTVLASLFMFRLIVFLYDVSTSATRPRLPEAVAYFFLIPNICSSLFPLVDFKTFCRSHYDSPDLQIYQRGMRWIIRGVWQLLLYRLIQQLASLDPQHISSGTDLIQFIFASTFVYVQVSGLFHLSIGMLLLFGFNLPETNKRYFLAASFTDYWRRVNIYWKDFILKVFYYPAYFRLKRFGATTALVVATLWSFFITWALHLYQTWWLKGAASLRWTDVLFWSILALLVLVTSLWEMKRGRRRKLASSSYSVADSVSLLLRTGLTFSCIAVLWSLWSTPELSDWVAMWAHFDASTLLWYAVGVVVIMAATVFFEILPQRSSTPAASLPASQAGAFLRGSALLLLLLLAGNPRVQGAMGDRWQPVIDAVNTGDSMMDRAVTRNRGYYEQLTSVDNGNLQLMETLVRQRRGYDYEGPFPTRLVDDFRFREALANVDMQAYDTHYTTNSVGMRDREYPLAKPAGTVRIALLGSSHSMGWGVLQNETFADILEQRLNAAASRSPTPAFEVLNFSMYGYSPLGQIDLLRQKVAAYKPDVVIVVSHPIEYRWVAKDLHLALAARQTIAAPFLQKTVADARITPRTHETIAAKRLARYESPLLGWAYTELAAEARAIGAEPILALTLIPNDLEAKPAPLQEQIELGRRAGFTLFDFTRLFDGLAAADIELSEGYHHMNAHAHRLVAEALHRSIIQDPDFQAIVRRNAPATTAPTKNDRG